MVCRRPVFRVTKRISFCARSRFAHVREATSESLCPLNKPNFMRDFHSSSATASTARNSSRVKGRRVGSVRSLTPSTPAAGSSTRKPSFCAARKKPLIAFKVLFVVRGPLWVAA